MRNLFHDVLYVIEVCMLLLLGPLGWVVLWIWWRSEQREARLDEERARHHDLMDAIDRLHNKP